MKTRHTPGSWSMVKYPDVKGHTIYALAGSGNGHRTLASVKHPNPEIQEANAARIVACVNACEGIEDPAKLREQRDELLKELRDTVMLCSDVISAAAQQRAFHGVEVSAEQLIGFKRRYEIALAAIAKATGGKND